MLVQKGILVTTASFDTPEKMIRRKDDHIRICATADVEGSRESMSDAIRLSVCTFPECDFADIVTKTSFLGRAFDLPLFITGMTGGVASGFQINEVLAVAAQRQNIPLGLGSQKLMVSSPSTATFFQVRKRAPKVFLIGNIGAVSANYGITSDDIKKIVETCELDAFAIHINALQECIQPEGERNFKGLFQFIESLVNCLSVPVIVKEVGAGMDTQTALRLANLGVAAIDVGGAGGTSWSFIEGQRGDDITRRLGTLFKDWGISTPESLTNIKKIFLEKNIKMPVTATGGVRDGLYVAKLIGLGASMVGVGLPLFRVAVEALQHKKDFEYAVQKVEEEIEFFKRSLAIAMFCSGSKTLDDLTTRIEFKRKNAYEF